MTQWQTEIMEENARNTAWEDLNAPDPCEKELKEAARELRLSMEALNSAENYLYDAVSELAETPMADMVQSVVEEMMGLHRVIKQLADLYGKGCRE
jgi:hypothetical protein